MYSVGENWHNEKSQKPIVTFSSYLKQYVATVGILACSEELVDQFVEGRTSLTLLTKTHILQQAAMRWRNI
jgi:hypothetical protein